MHKEEVALVELLKEWVLEWVVLVEEGVLTLYLLKKENFPMIL
jgi:hypothetical protein